MDPDNVDEVTTDEPCADCEKTIRRAMAVGLGAGVVIGLGVFWILTRGR